MGQTPAIYADFHDLCRSKRTAGLSAVPLDAYGSLRDLSNKHMRLRENMPLVIYMDSDAQEDLQAEAIAYYDPVRAQWMAEIDYDKIGYAARHAEWIDKSFLCFGCRRDLAPYFEAHGRDPEMHCPDCGTSILAVVAAP